MEFNKYYQEELAYLRDMGDAFSHHYPKLAPFLAYDSNDPDVERLLEGFSFLTAKLRQKLDDEVPEFTTGLFTSLWPHFLRPVPAMSIMEFTPLESAVVGKKLIQVGAEVESKVVEGTRCCFRTAYDVEILPICISSVSAKNYSKKGQLFIEIKSTNGQMLSELDADKIRLYVGGDKSISRQLYLALSSYVNSAGMLDETDGGYHRIDEMTVSPVGFSSDEKLIPYPDNVSDSYRLLQEFFTFPEKFHFFDISGIRRALASEHGEKATIVIDFSRELLVENSISTENLKLFCTPVINIFKRDGDPFRRVREKTEYSLRPSGKSDIKYQIFSVDRVYGISQGNIEKKKYLNYYGTDNLVQNYENDKSSYYQLSYQPSTIGDRIDTIITFQGFQPSSKTEVIGSELSCTNGDLTNHLHIGDICEHGFNTPEFVKPKNVSRVSESFPAPIHLNIDWALIGSLAVNNDSLTNLSTLKQLVSLYDFPSFYSKQAKRAHQLRQEGILELVHRPCTRLFRQLPINGLEVEFLVDSTKFSDEGDLVLFFSVINRMFELQTQLNTFVETKVRDQETGEVYQWTGQKGKRVGL